MSLCSLMYDVVKVDPKQKSNKKALFSGGLRLCPNIRQASPNFGCDFIKLYFMLYFRNDK